MFPGTALPLSLGLSRSKGSLKAVFRLDSRDDNVETECRENVFTLSAAFDWVRNGLSKLPIWLKVLPAAPAALCSGAKVGLFGLCCALGSAVPSGGVTKGSSGGCCWTTGRVVTDGYDLKDGVPFNGTSHSRDNMGSIVISGTGMLLSLIHI